MKDLNEVVAKLLSDCMKKGENDMIECFQSEVHECEIAYDAGLAVFITPSGKLKSMTNVHSRFCLPHSKEITSCVCGFKPPG